MMLRTLRASLFVLALVRPSIGLADTAPPRTPPAGDVQVHEPAALPKLPEGESVASGGERASGAPVTARQLGAMLLRDADGNVVAKVQDLIIDPCRGRVIYAAVSYGQVVGIGDVLYVVPWECVETLPGSHELRLTIASDLVRNGPRFAMNSWPNFADREYRATVEQYYAQAGASRRAPQIRPIIR